MTEYLTTEGKVISASVGVKQSIDTSISGKSARLIDMYYPDITYEYTVNGESYQSNRFWDEEIKIGQLEKIEPIVAQYTTGTEITVYYDPQNPANSYLQQLPEVDLGRLKRWSIGIGAMVLVGIALLIILLQQG